MQKMIIQGRNSKAFQWGELIDKDSEVIYTNGNSISLLINVIMNLTSTDIIFIRYINDHKNLTITLFYLLSDILIVKYSMIFNVRIIKIIHNYPNDTKVYYNKINKIRRSIYQKSSYKNVTTDQYISEHVINFKTCYLPFSYYQNKNKLVNEEFTKKLLYILSENSSKYVIHAIGSYENKVLQYEHIHKYYKAGFNNNYFVVITKSLPDRLHQAFINYHNQGLMFYSDSGIYVNEEIIKEYVDAYIKVYNDVSIPLTLVMASHFNKPFLSKTGIFLGDLISYYNNGFTYSNLSQLNEISLRDHSLLNYKKFNEQRKNSNIRKKLMSIIYD